MLSTKGRSRKGNEWLGWSTCHGYFSSTFQQSISSHVNIHNKQNSLVLERGRPSEVPLYTQEMGLTMQGSHSCWIHSCSLNSLAQIILKVPDILGYDQLNNCLLMPKSNQCIFKLCVPWMSGQVRGGRSEIVQSCISELGAKLKKNPFTINESCTCSGQDFLFFLILWCNPEIALN